MQQSRFRPEVRTLRAATLVALFFLTLAFVSCGHGARFIGMRHAAPASGGSRTAPTSGSPFARFDESLGIKVADGAGGSFVIFPVDGRERLIPDAKRLYAASASAGAGGAITLTVTSSQQQTLSDAFFYIKYDAARLSPTSCTFGDGIVGRQMLTLALTDQRDILPAGFAGIRGATVSLAAGQPVLTATFANRPFAATKRTSSVVTGSENQVQDWRVTTNPDNTVTYEWTQRLVGDYNSDGMVGITDLVPVAQLYGDPTNDNQVSPTARSWTNGELLRSRDDELGWLKWDYDIWDKITDGNSDKEVGIGDLQPIANHYGETIQGYDCYFGSAKVYAAGQSGLMPSISTPMTLGTAETGATMVSNPDLPRLFKMTFTPGSGTGLSAIRKRSSGTAPVSNGLIPVDGAGNMGRSDSWLNHIIDVTAVVNALTREVQYTVVVAPSADSYVWDFDDGTTSTEQNPTHTFVADGDYFVTVTITDIGSHILHVLPKLTLAAATPWAPTALGGTASSTPPYDVTLDWTVSTDPAVTSYDVWYAVTPNDANPARFNSPTLITAPPVTIPGALVPGAVFLYYRVSAIKPVIGGKMESDYSNEWHNQQGPDATPPTWIGLPGIQGAAPGDGTVSVSWGTALDAQTPPGHYTLYWMQEPVAPSTFFSVAAKIADVTSPYVFGTHPAETPVNGTAYRFGVRASDTATPPNEDQNMVSLTATPGDYVPPAWDTTAGITGATPGPGQVTVTWGTATDAKSPPVTYNIYYSTTSQIDFPTASKISGIPNNPTGSPPTNSYVVGSLTNGVAYYFAVRALDSAPSHNEDVNTGALGATPRLPIVSGSVAESGIGLEGVLMTLTPGGLTATTQSDGTYAIAGVANGSYTLKSSKPGYVFVPASRPVFVSGADATGEDFAAMQTGLADSAWPKFRRNEGNTGLSTYIGAQTNNVKWSHTTGGEVVSSPAIGVDGTVYVGSRDYNVFALNPSDGSVKWVYTTGLWVQSSPAIGGDGTVYVGSGDSNVYALNPTDGTVKWIRTTGGQVNCSPAIGADGTIYVGSYDHNLYALSPANGSVKWSHTTGNAVGTSVAVATDGTLYLGGYDSKLYALNPADGSVRWSLTAGVSRFSSPAIGADGTVYVGCDDHNVYALNPTDGSVKWTRTTGNEVWGPPAIGADGTVYVGSDDYNVYALNPADGSVKWTYATGNPVSSSPAIDADGTVYVGSGDANVYALNPADGTVKWNYATGRPVYGSPAIGADGTVYIGSYDGNLYAFGP